MKILAAQRLLSQKTTQEKITHYQKMLTRVKHRLIQLNSETQPRTVRRYITWAIRLEKRIINLQSQHRH